MLAGLSFDTLIVRLLAVAGGAAGGAFLVGSVLRLGGRVLGGRQAPRLATTTVRALGATAAGLAVWLYVSGLGGSHWGPGGGGSVFGGTGSGTESGPAPQTSAVPSNRVTKLSSTPDETIRVILLGGERVKDGRFYEVPATSGAMTFAELTDLLRRRQRDTGLKTVEILIYSDSVAENHAAVRRLIQWAKENGLAVRLPPSRSGEAP